MIKAYSAPTVSGTQVEEGCLLPGQPGSPGRVGKCLTLPGIYNNLVIAFGEAVVAN